MHNIDKLYADAVKADNDFQRELVRCYGARASEARYYWTHADVDVIAASERRQEITSKLLKAMQQY